MVLFLDSGFRTVKRLRKVLSASIAVIDFSCRRISSEHIVPPCSVPAWGNYGIPEVARVRVFPRSQGNSRASNDTSHRSDGDCQRSAVDLLHVVGVARGGPLRIAWRLTVSRRLARSRCRYQRPSCHSRQFHQPQRVQVSQQISQPLSPAASLVFLALGGDRDQE